MKKIIVWALLCAILSMSSCKNCGDPAPYLFSTDTAFINNTLRIGLSEIEIGELAVAKGQSNSVRIFGRQIVDDHKIINAALAQIATKYGYSSPYKYTMPSKPDNQHILINTQLSTMTGIQFDSLFITEQINDHEKMVIDFQTEISASKIGDIKSFSRNYLPIIQKHLTEAQTINDSI